MGAKMTSTTNSDLLLDVFHGKLFIDALRENLVAQQFGITQDAPRSSGKNVRWQYFSNPSAVTTPLSEGNDPTSPTDLSTTAVEASAQEYGAYFNPTKTLYSTGATGTKAEIVKAAGYQAAISIDTMVYTQALYAAGSTIGSTSTDMTAGLLKTSYQTLMAASAKPNPKTDGGKYFALILAVETHTDLVNEATDFDEPQAPTFWMIHQTDAGLRGAKDVPNTGGSQYIWGHQIYVSQNVPQETASSFNNYAIGNEAFGVLSIDTDIIAPRIIITDPEQRVDLALRSSGTVGWWINWVSKLIQSASMVEILTDET